MTSAARQSQILTVPSPPPAASRSPAGWKATPWTSTAPRRTVGSTAQMARTSELLPVIEAEFALLGERFWMEIGPDYYKVTR